MNSVLVENQLKDLNMNNLTIEEKFQAAIQEENLEKVKTLINNLDDIEFVVEIIEDPDTVLVTALEVGNLEILKLLLESEIIKVKTGDYELACFDIVSDQSYDDEKKVKIVEFLLPYVYTKNAYPWLPGYYSPIDFFDDLYGFCLNKDLAIVEFFIEKFYSEKYNNFYPVIKRLLGTFEGSHLICILLHQEIEGLDELFPHYRLFGLCEQIGKAFVNLLVTNDGMKLAVEVFKILLDKNFAKVFESFEESGSYIRRKKNKNTEDEEKITPLLLKRLFQFVYHVWDSETEDVIFEIISGWIFVCASKYGTFSKSCYSLLPFMIKPKYLTIIAEICESHVEFIGGKEMIRKMFIHTEEQKVLTLKEICGYLIKSKIAKSIDFQPKELINHVWELRLPDVLKCYLLAIPDASWVNELKAN